MALEHKEFYKRSLPHYQPGGACLFVTFRLAGTFPKNLIASIKNAVLTGSKDLKAVQRKIFQLYESNLDAGKTGPLWLKDPRVAGIVADSIRHRDGKQYSLDAYCIMTNHVHMVFSPLSEGGSYFSLNGILKSLKQFTARQANSILGRTGAFWAAESYDRVIRGDEEWRRIVRYVLLNPVKAGLIDDWVKWPWSYYRTGIEPRNVLAD